MKTLSFHNFKIGRDPNRVLLNLDSAGQTPLTWQSGVHLIVAPNGFGKTTLFQTLAGVLSSLEGSAKINGETLVPSQHATYVSEYLAFPKYIYPHEWIEFFSGQRLKGSIAKGNENLEEWIKKFRLGELMRSFLGRMSQGERRKVTWLGAHMSKKPLVLMDEPLDGLDLLAVEAARQMLQEWKSQGRIIGLVAHQVGEVLDLADEIYFIRDQKLIPWSSHFGDRVDAAAKAWSREEFRKKVFSFYST